MPPPFHMILIVFAQKNNIIYVVRSIIDAVCPKPLEKMSEFVNIHS